MWSLEVTPISSVVAASCFTLYFSGVLSGVLAGRLTGGLVVVKIFCAVDAAVSRLYEVVC